jgi:Ca2+-binding RTX toxin-like protein
MPSIIPSPGPRPTTFNLTGQINILSGQVASVAVGRVIYAGLFRVFSSDEPTAELRNDGAIWNNTLDNVGAVAAGYNFGLVVNTGLIVSEAYQGNAYGVSVSSSGQGVVNSGSIFAIAGRNGIANAITHWDPDARVENSGLIAAQTPATGDQNTGGASGIAMYNGGRLINQASGRILVEGNAATAIVFGRGNLLPPFNPQIVNYGQIEAVSLRADSPSIGISVSSLQVEYLGFDNFGTLKADIAYQSRTEFYSPPQLSVDNVTNRAGGTIIGEIRTGLGNDVVINAGSIQGNLLLGNGEDLFDNRGGSLVGIVDFGWGNDRFLGSEQAEAAVGGRSADSLYGNGGNDLLLGGNGDDVLVGGSGNDTLYGEFGDDLIQVLGGDRVIAGTGNDRIELADLAFASLDGGAGTDVLILPNVAGTLNIGALLSSARVSGFEQVRLSASGTNALLASDAAAVRSAAGELAILGSSSSNLVLAGGWQESSNRSIDGLTFRTFISGTTTIVVQSLIGVTLSTSSPVDLVGLSSIGAGPAAPSLTDFPGVSLASNIQTSDYYNITENLTIDREEIWRAADSDPVLTSYLANATITNLGTIESVGVTNNLARAVFVQNLDLLVNQGTIRASGIGGAYATAYEASSYGRLINTGSITATATTGRALGVQVQRSIIGDGAILDNAGTIRAEAITGKALGAFVVGFGPTSIASNSGLIEAIGNADTWALQLYATQQFTNSGRINSGVAAGTIDANDAAVFISGRSYDTLTFTNSGRISGHFGILADPFGISVALSLANSTTGTISGIVRLSNGNDSIVNQGQISGVVELGGGDDRFDGRGGSQSAGVVGGFGDDRFVVDGQATLIYELAGEGVDTIDSAGNYYLYANIENLNLIAGAGDIFGVGNELANAINGNEGANLLLGGAGDDVVNGGTGGDSLFGEDGADTLNGDAGIDYLIGGRGNDVINGGDGADALYGETGDDVLNGGASFSTDILVGGAGNDVLNGISGQNNPDYDLLDGGSGDDIYFVDTGADLTFEAVGAGIDTVYANIPVAGAGVYLYTNVENLVLQGTTAFGVGNELSNLLIGNAIGNYLLGGAGDDFLNGGQGNDVLFGEGGRDVFAFERGTGGDVIGDFLHGADQIRLVGLGFTSFSQLQSNFVQNGLDGAINLGQGDFVVLHNVTMSSLTAVDFILG